MDEKRQFFILDLVNRIGFWLVHIVAANCAPLDAMDKVYGMIPGQAPAEEEIEDLDDDTDED